MLKLIDISHYQNITDLNAVKNDGLSGIICKATDGLLFTDSTFSYRMTHIPKLGIIPGSYHFARPLQDPVKQSQKYCRTITPWGPLLTALDLEESHADTQVSEDWAQNSVDENCAWVLAWLAEFKKNFVGLPFIYSRYNFMNQYLKGLDLSTYPSWIADYESQTSPTLLPYFKTWSCWQRSESDHEAGIVGPNDLDVFNGTIEDLKGLLCTPIS